MTENRFLLQRLNAVMQEVSYIQKERKQGMRYSVVCTTTLPARSGR